MDVQTLAKPKGRYSIQPPSRWVCPNCESKIITHIPTYTPECRSAKHRGNLVYMEAK